MAASEALAQRLQPVRLFTGCAFLMDGRQVGRAWRCARKRPYREVWLQIWEHISDLGHDRLEIIKIKAHETAQGVLNGRIEKWQHIGSSIVDGRARLGASMHP